MKRLLLSLMVLCIVTLVACGTDGNEQENNTNEAPKETQDENQNEELNENQQEGQQAYEGSSLEEGEEKADLLLQVSKVDEASGITIDNNELYSDLQAMIDEDPQMGEHDDISFFPINIVEFEDDSLGLVVLLINRLNNPIRNIRFDFTIGDINGKNMIEDEPIELTEDYLGQLEENSAIPFIVDINAEDEELFYSLTSENIHLEATDFGIDFVE